MKFSKDNLIASSELVDVYRCGDTCVKLFKEGVRKTNPLYEALTHSRVEDTGLPVPVIHELSVIDGRWAIHMDLIEGKTLADLMKENPANMDKYLNDMVDIQLEIHSKSVPKLSKLKDKMSRQINSLTEIDDVKKYELLTRLESMPKHTKLCHGNFVPENIIYNEKGMYVVDWIAARRAMRARMWGGPTCFSVCGIRHLRINTSICSARKPIPTGSMYSAGCRSWQRRICRMPNRRSTIS